MKKVKQTISLLLIVAMLCSCCFISSATTNKSFVLGDVDGDGHVTSNDARLTLRCAVGLEVFNDEQIKAADLSYGGVVDAADARYILRYSVGIVDDVWSLDREMLVIDRSAFAYNESENRYSVYEEATIIKGTLKNANRATDISFTVKNDKGTIVDSGNIAVKSNWESNEIGFVTGENMLTVTVTYSNGTSYSDYVIADCYYNIHSEKLSIDVTSDADNDGLVDYLENYLGSNSHQNDTDNDGLSDYEEVMFTGTDPLTEDTDHDGVNDFDSDKDMDSLSNGYELSIGTKPSAFDSDGDFLSDFDEIYTYLTNPLDVDTDLDGAEDGWEVANDFDPKKYNDSFEVKVVSAELSENNSLSASVTLNTNGEQVTTIDVQPVGYAENPLLSSSIPGYLGAAYDFSVQGDFTQATITFEYDTKLGEISDAFQPRIYYFNEADGVFEELENQVVSDGKVSATVSHFSKYILLNKVEFDKVWKEEIKAPIIDGSGQSAQNIDVVFVIDTSGSMSGSRLSTAKNAMYAFLDALTDNDRAGLVSFTNSAIVRSQLTTNKSEVKSAVNNLYADGLTSMYIGFDNALDLLNNNNESYGYKMIIVLSDGYDEPSSNYETQYAPLVAEAAENNIVVYTIGTGASDTTVLTKVAEGTNGKYYEASQTDNIIDVFEVIQEETVDLTSDKNHDLIPDYYNDLLWSGDLTLSNGSTEFEGIDFNYDDNGSLCADADGDGLLNGEELVVVKNGDKVYVVMKSNPLMVHSDSDLIDDYTEVNNETNPLIYQANKSTVDALRSDSGYNYESVTADYENNWLLHADVEFLAAVYGVWNKDELYRDLLIDYFANYGEATYVKNLETEATKKYMVESLASVVSNIKKYWASPRGEISKICKLISQINGTADYETVKTLMFSSYSETVVEIFEMNPQLGTFSFTSYAVSKETTILVNLTNVSKGLDKLSKGLSYAAYGLDVADTIAKFAKVSANMEAFDQNADILRKMANESTNDHARNAAKSVLNSLGGGMGTEILKAVGADTILDIAANELIGFIAKKNIYVLAFVVIRDGLNLLTGIKTDIQQQYRMDLYSKLTDAINSLLYGIIDVNGNYVYVTNDNITDFTRLMTNLAQIRILGEKMYCEWMEFDGVLGWFIDNDDTEALVAQQVKTIKSLAKSLNLTLASSL